MGPILIDRARALDPLMPNNDHIKAKMLIQQAAGRRQRSWSSTRLNSTAISLRWCGQPERVER
jgi:hypothetical protein